MISDLGAKPKKRLFIGLLSASLLVLFSAIGLMWFLFTHRHLPLERNILLILTGAVLAFLIIVGFGIMGMVLTIWRARTVPVLENIMRVTINLLLPVAIPLGQVLGFDKKVIRSSFIEVNNQLVGAEKDIYQGNQVLLLAPHCLQMHDCPHKVTTDVHNCRRCGRCVVSGLLELEERYGVRLAVATGGTLARKFIGEFRPRAVIAIACERDLTSGIQDSNPLPVLGVLNIRPNGPCYETTVDLNRVERAIRYL
ncbi:MAG TPA: DUF116 domain-containing protein, partial [Bacillota bacterium]|nr:DUF116 domain-containing protein [Bacillota bacterium]